MAHVADRHDTLVSSFEALRQDASYGPDWLRTLRASAFARFLER